MSGADDGAAGDRQEFERLFMPYYKDAHLLARHMLKDDHEAEDAVQEAFLKAFAARKGVCDGVKREECLRDPRAWIVRICRNECLDRSRRKWIPGGADKDRRANRDARRRDRSRRIEFLEGFVREGDDASTSQQHGSLRDRERARQELASDPWGEWFLSFDRRTALAELSPDEIEAWLLVDLMGFSAEDAAAILDVPPPTMRTRISRARRRLLVSLGAWPTAELGRGEPAELQGLYHQPRGNAFVVSLEQRKSDRRSIERLFASLESGSGGTAWSVAGDNGHDLFRFLERLDGEVPDCKRMIALIDHRSAAQHETAEWAGAHPRWRCLRFSHREWLTELEQFFGRCTSDSAKQVRRVVGLIDDRQQPFVWIPTAPEGSE